MSLLQNVCKFSQCGLIFSSLGQLIEHIEGTHINFDQHFMRMLEKEKPEALPMSYVLPFNVKKDNSNSIESQSPSFNNATLTLMNPESNYNVNLFGITNSDIEDNSNYDFKDFDVDDCEEDDDTDFNLNSDEEFSAEFIMRYGSQHSGNKFEEKPFACPVPGCLKRYKNINGIRYHAKNGHKRNSKTGKNFECFCGKSYKSAQGLKNHTSLVHKPIETISMNLSTSPLPLQLPLPMSLTQVGETLSFSIATSLPNSFDELCKPTVEGVSNRCKTKTPDLLFHDISLSSDKLTSFDDVNQQLNLTAIETETTCDLIDVGDANDFVCTYCN